MSFDKGAFIKFALENNVVGFLENPVELSSGGLSHLYINWRNVTDDVFLTDKLTDFIIEFTNSHGLNPDTFYGVPEGATKLGIITQYKCALQSENYGKRSHVLAMGRGKLKKHGIEKDRYFLGQPKGRTIILEDVVTTGSSLIKEIARLRENRIRILAAISLTDRSGMREFGVPYYTLSNVRDLFQEGCKTLNPPQGIIKSIEEELEVLEH